LWRIVAVGDSNTFGGGDDSNTYPAHFDGLLRSLERNGRRFEVVNAGIQGLDSTHALRRLRTRVLALSPDVVTIYIGWNDLMKFDPLGQSDAGGGFSALSRGIDRLWLVKGMRKLFFMKLRSYVDPPRTGADGRSGRFTDFEPTIYKDNLLEMIREIRATGAKPVLMTLPTVVREDMSVADLQRQRVFFPFYRSAYGVGDLLDLVAAYNRTVRLVAADQAVPIADLSGLFEARSDFLGLFFDTMHPNSTGNAVIAEYLMQFFQEHELLGEEGASLTRAGDQ
jgi:lysophospholipase L1-like esterase